MYHVLVVDDELLIRQGLRYFIDWEKHGFQIIGEASNGEEALSFFTNQRIDVVITDIRMPVIDGFTLIDNLHNLGFHPFFVILSGYSEFEYAKKAMDREVIYYLLKPLDEEELIGVFERIKAKLDKNPLLENSYILTEEFIKTSISGTDKNRRIVTAMLKYMEDHIQEEGLLDELGRSFSLSNNYISILMKEQFGVGFHSILTQMRIGKAKMLLRDDLTLKTYEISELVGYKDPQYFSRLFHKKVGMTPSEFREKSGS